MWRGALSFCNSPQMGAPEAYIQFTPGLITDDGEVTDKSTEQFLRDFMEAFAVFVTRVLPVLPTRGLTCTAVVVVRSESIGAEREVDAIRRVWKLS